MKRRTALAMITALGPVALYLVVLCSSASAENSYGITLKPGERLVAVNGVPVHRSTATRQSSAAQTVSADSSMYRGTDQQRAQAEANYMAQNGIKGHVGGQIGNFEGCGWSSGGTPPTCTPGRGMTLTADAIAYGRDGAYRVRAWR